MILVDRTIPRKVTRMEEPERDAFSLKEQEGQEEGGTAFLGSGRRAAAGENATAVGGGGNINGGEDGGDHTDDFLDVGGKK